jgi:hypothetical protein
VGSLVFPSALARRTKNGGQYHVHSGGSPVFMRDKEIFPALVLSSNDKEVKVLLSNGIVELMGSVSSVAR